MLCTLLLWQLSVRLEYGSWAFMTASSETEAQVFQSLTFLFCCSNESRETKYKDNTRDVHAEDVHHVDANRLRKKKTHTL